LPYASAPLVWRASIAHETQKSALRSARATTLPRPPHPMPNVRDDRDTPLCEGPGWREYAGDLRRAETEIFLQMGLDRANHTTACSRDQNMSRAKDSRRRQAAIALSDRATQKSPSAKLGRIVVARGIVMIGPQTTRSGIVAIDPHTARSDVAFDHSLAGINDDMPRPGAMYARGVGGST
jgi:hypothetical protein